MRSFHVISTLCGILLSQDFDRNPVKSLAKKLQIDFTNYFSSDTKISYTPHREKPSCSKNLREINSLVTTLVHIV